MTLNNAGIPVEVSRRPLEDITDSLHDLLAAQKQHSPLAFSRDIYQTFLPSAKELQSLDVTSSSVPVMAVKVTVFEPGTVLGVVMLHGVGDAQSMLNFMVHWAAEYRGVPRQQIVRPDYSMDVCDSCPADMDRIFENEYKILPVMSVKPSAESMKSKGQNGLNKSSAISTPDTPPPDKDAAASHACVIPVTKTTLTAWKFAAKQELLPGTFVSSDDILTAHVWRTMCRIRCAKLGIPTNSSDQTTMIRAINLRSKVSPPLAPGFFGNSSLPTWTVLSVQQLLAMSPVQVALHLRSALQAWTTDRLSAHLKWISEHQKRQSIIVPKVKANCFTFMISSWNFSSVSWESVDFDCRPFSFHQDMVGQLPHASFPLGVMTSRPGKDGFNVATSGPEDDMEEFMTLMTSQMYPGYTEE